MKNPWKHLSKVNPQRENGNRQINNEVFKALMTTDFTITELKVCLCILHHTWGFGKTEDAISIRIIARETSLCERAVRYALKSLKQRRVIYFEPSRSVHRGSPLNSYLLNKHYDTWLDKGVHRRSGVHAASEKSAKGGRKRVHGCADTKETTKERTKESVEDEIPFAEIIVDLNQKSGKSFRHTTAETRRAISARWHEGYGLPDFQTVHSVKCDEWLGTEYDKFLRPSTLYRQSNFENYLNQSGNQRRDAMSKGPLSYYHKQEVKT